MLLQHVNHKNGHLNRKQVPLNCETSDGLSESLVSGMMFSVNILTLVHDKWILPLKNLIFTSLAKDGMVYTSRKYQYFVHSQVQFHLSKLLLGLLGRKVTLTGSGFRRRRRNHRSLPRRSLYRSDCDDDA